MSTLSSKQSSMGIFIRQKYLDFFKEPHTIKEAAEFMAVNYYTARNYVTDLETRGMIRLVTKQGREFVYQTSGEGGFMPSIQIFGAAEPTPLNQWLTKNLDKNTLAWPIRRHVHTFHRFFYRELVKLIQEYKVGEFDKDYEPDPDVRRQMKQHIRKAIATHLSTVENYAVQLRMLLDNPMLSDDDNITAWVNKLTNSELDTIYKFNETI